MGNIMKHFERSLVLLAIVLPIGVAGGQGYSPEDAVRRMRVPDGFEVKLAASEPDCRQPVTMSFDDRGRLWVIQYLQYPAPAGLKPIKVDQYLRTKYDRVPEPPPRGPKGADRITIFEDTRGDGHFKKAKDFVTGLNLASGMALGYDGVFVVQPPYLLFYPDRNHDDVPDGDPEVLLSGFGMEDAHALANSLLWGPDGWLYGVQGSTVTANIRGISFQQGIWRYHPRSREFELFAEGGGNTWGLDFDRHGNAIASTNYGTSAVLHQVQGGYYVKGFSKHGELHNPYAFGYFDHVPYQGFRGGHVTCGGILYRGGSFPKEFTDTFIAANPLSNAIFWHVLTPQRSSFTARFGGELVAGNDTWFRPVDCLVGPDGSLFVADWYDKRINHVDPVDNWDRSNGRIYKIEARGTKPAAGLPLSGRSSLELVGLLDHPNDWYVREARRILSERRDPLVIPILRKKLRENTGQLALECLWALYVSGGFDDATAAELLGHSNQDVRTWTVRLLGDAKRVSPTIRTRLVQLARTESCSTVRSQLACTCKRLPGNAALPIVRELLEHREDEDDPHIPLLLWWAIEDKAASHREQVLQLLTERTAWSSPLIRNFIVERLSRRYMAAGTSPDLDACGRLLDLAPSPDDAERVIRGMEKALEGRSPRRLPAPIEKKLMDLWKTKVESVSLIRLGLRVGLEPASERALSVVADQKSPVADRISLIETLGQVGQPESVPVLLRLLRAPEPPAVRRASLSALQAFASPEVSHALLDLYPSLPSDLRTRAQALLCSRPSSAREFLRAVDSGMISPKEVSFDMVRQAVLHRDPEIRRLAEKHWGKIGGEPPGEKRARIASVKHMLGTGVGDPGRGKALYDKKCATCHTLFGEGNRIGPELTGADRKDREFLVTSVVDPSAVIRNEYVAYLVTTKNGRLLTGLISETTPKTVIVLDAKNERTILDREEVEEIKPSPESLMPEKILDDLDEQQIRDLFSYIQGNGLTAAGQPARAEAAMSARALRVCLVSGSLEYRSDESLSRFQKYLEDRYHVQCSRAFRRSDDDVRGLENLEHCDVMLLFTRRLSISGQQLERVKKYCAAGKPVVAVRTASHAFQNWLALDRDVLGGDYQGHYGVAPLVDVRLRLQTKDHPILDGVRAFQSPGSLYKNPRVAPDVEVLLTGSIRDHTEPVAWTRLHNGGHIFYTSLGHPQDFNEESFRQLLANALFWCVKRPVSRR
jgi:putative membrane-bound dehydrogenase-like protein